LRTIKNHGYYVISSSLPELQNLSNNIGPDFDFEYSSSNMVVRRKKVKEILIKNDLLSIKATTGELLR
jgi:hypothetical protein